MEKINNYLEDYLLKKKKDLIKQKKISLILSTLLRWSIMILNLIVIALAAWVINVEIKRYNGLNPLTRKSFFDENGLTIVFASFLVIVFLFNLFLAFYTPIMKWKDYKNAMNELEYIKHKNDQDKTYEKEGFLDDLENIKKTWLFKNKISFKETLKKFLLDKNA
ncbi:unknown; predicted coding region [Mycoplasmopsis pulmonis]|uniref:Uncharacterized protein n=1 Tax=Mycoplasmopsis pulmonis (strain UAB CTIP) TaxID=272635 RepID=Q98Q35_MYCPU|nr:hypothetical protein [Mycoplasmopsis pulmonis]MDZ7293662.1 hypothetical protein [Mycoplasmopsis pulmonis]CAC13707.1 unknown; predicted coding region [Mycoplasmopsis pulmonis]VEU68299.1 Uncharacterised protein [Mycoplasmopsis pulmonis]